jgi:hypothetical protein
MKMVCALENVRATIIKRHDFPSYYTKVISLKASPEAHYHLCPRYVTPLWKRSHRKCFPMRLLYLGYHHIVMKFRY